MEVIVVDDGSTDNSSDIINEFAGQVIAISKPNGGQGSAYNAGFKICRGDYIIFLDADDFLLPGSISAVIDKISRTPIKAGQFISKIHYPLVIVDETGHPTGKLEPARALPHGNMRDEVIEKGGYLSPPASGNVYSRQFLTQVLPMNEPDWRGGADCYLFNIAPLYGILLSIGTPLACYRVHGVNMSVIIVNGKIRSSALLNDINIDCKVRSLIMQNIGVYLSHQQVLDDPSYLKIRTRLIMKKMFPTDYPFQESLPILGRKILKSIWASREPVKKKLIYSTWVSAVFLLPRKIAFYLIKPIYRLRTFQGALPSRNEVSA